MSFRLATIFWVFAVVAVGIVTFGPGGIAAAVLVFGFWVWKFYGPKLRLTLVRILVIVAVFALLLALLLSPLALLLPAVQSAREAARRAQCVNNLKQIALALLNYENATGSFPPAYVADASGKPIHSWRVLILPYLGQQALFNKYRMNEPWDGPNNRKLAAQIPNVYRCPAQANDPANQSVETHYFAVVDPQTAWPGSRGRRIRDIVDGTSKTILVLEASGVQTNWMEPRDLSLEEGIELLTTKPRSGHLHVSENFFTTTYYETSYRNVARADGSVHWHGQFSDAEFARTFLTAQGRETNPPDLDRQYFRPDVTRTVVNWNNVYALAVFLVLAILPAFWRFRAGTLQREREVQEQVTVGPLASG